MKRTHRLTSLAFVAALACILVVPCMAYADEGDAVEAVDESTYVEQVTAQADDAQAVMPADGQLLEQAMDAAEPAAPQEPLDSTGGAANPDEAQAGDVSSADDVTIDDPEAPSGEESADQVEALPDETATDPTSGVDPEVADQPEAVAEPAAEPQSTTEPEPMDGDSATEEALAVEQEHEEAQAAASEPALAAQGGETALKASINYRTHVQKDGWQGYVKDGKTAGTSGRSLRLEGIKIYLTDANGKVIDGAQGGVQYQVHVQRIGWQDVKSGNAMAGTEGKSYRLEAIRISLTGELSRFYDVTYRTHVQSIGWQDWKRNGQTAGTEGRGLRLEAIEIKLQPKSTPTAATADGIVGVRYRAHVQSVGWQGYAANGATAGTSGRALRVEAINIALDKGRYSGGIEYEMHVQKIGWQGPKANGAMAGTTGKSLRVEAFKINLTGDIAKSYDVVYRAHVQGIGWQNWTLDGAVAGTTGKSLRVEALQVKLVKKGSNQVVSEGTYFISAASNPQIAIEDPSSSANANVQQKSAAASGNSFAQRYYVRDEGSGTYSIQSVVSGLFLADNGGKVVQVADSSATANRWKIVWDAGYSLVNVASGKEMAFASGKVAKSDPIATKGQSTANAQQWMLSKTSLIPSGTYYIANEASGNYLNIEGTVWKNGSNVGIGKKAGNGRQAFTVTDKGSDAYEIASALTYKAVAGSGSDVKQAAASGAASQLWVAEFTRGGDILFVNKSTGKALNATGKAAVGANVNQAAKNVQSANQHWKLQGTSYSLTGDKTLDKKLAKILNSHNTISSVFNYVSGSFGYIEGARFYSGPRYHSDSTTRSYALYMINHGGGNCYKYASLFSWLARGLGYKTNVCNGWVPRAGGGQAPHGWVEVYEGGTTYCYDPDLCHEIGGSRWYRFTYAAPPTNYGFW